MKKILTALIVIAMLATAVLLAIPGSAAEKFTYASLNLSGRIGVGCVLPSSVTVPSWYASRFEVYEAPTWYESSDGTNYTKMTNSTAAVRMPLFQANHNYKMVCAIRILPGYQIDVDNAEIEFIDSYSTYYKGKITSSTLISRPGEDYTRVCYLECIFRGITEYIKEIKITGVDTPVFGKTPDLLFDIPWLCGYNKGGAGAGDGVQWYKSKDGKKFEDMEYGAHQVPADKFIAGYYYQFHTYIGLEPGYAFASNVKLTVNGKAGEVKLMSIDNSQVAEVSCSFLCGSPVSKVEIQNVSTIKAGEKPSYFFDIPAGAKYVKAGAGSGDGAYWEFSSDGVQYNAFNHFPLELQPFEYDKYYAFSTMIMAADGYYFTDDVSATVNGKPAIVRTRTMRGDNEVLDIICYYDPLPKTAVKKVEIINVAELVPGKVPSFSFSLPSGAPYFKDGVGSGSGVQWSYSKDGKKFTQMAHMEPEAVEYDTYYQFHTMIAPATGYYFPSDLVVTVNGKTAKWTKVSTPNSAEGIDVTCVFEPIKRQEIDEVDILNVDVIEPGRVPSFLFMLPEGAKYEKAGAGSGDGVQWAWSTDGRTFIQLDHMNPEAAEYDKYYRFHTVIAPSDGYVFANNLKVKVNGSDATWSMIDGTDAIDVEFIYDPVASQKIEKVEILDVDTLTVGKVPSFIFNLPADAKYEKAGAGSGSGVQWSFSKDGKTFTQMAHMEPEAVEYDTYYQFHTVIAPMTGYTFPDSLKVYVNGKEAQWARITGLANNAIDVTYVMKSETAPLIDTIAITDVDTLTVGEVPSFFFTLPDGAPYVKAGAGSGDGVVWSMSKDGITYENLDHMDPEAVEKGTYYKFFTIIGPAEGRAFADTLTVTVNGNKANYYFTPDKNFVSVEYVIKAGTGKTIDKVELTDVDTLTVGKVPSFFFTIAEEAPYEKAGAGSGDGVVWSMSKDGKTYDNLDHMDPEAVEDNTYYQFFTIIAPSDGYDFADDLTVTVNGKPAEYKRYETGEISVTYVIEVGKPSGSSGDDIISQLKTALGCSSAAEAGFAIIIMMGAAYVFRKKK